MVHGQNVTKKVTGKYAWKPEFKAHFVNSLQLDSTKDKLNILDSKISESTSHEDVTTCLSDFSTIINDIAEPILNVLNPQIGNTGNFLTATLTHGTMTNVEVRNLCSCIH